VLAGFLFSGEEASGLRNALSYTNGPVARLEAGGSPFDYAQDKQTGPYDLQKGNSLDLFVGAMYKRGSV
jgi:hypothetical protein